MSEVVRHDEPFPLVVDVTIADSECPHCGAEAKDGACTARCIASRRDSERAVRHG